MALHTQQSLSGFIASEPRLTVTDRGDTRFYAKIGQEHYHRNPDGSFTQLETTFHDLVLYRRTAERAHAAFAKGDKFVAEGYVHTYEYLSEFGQTKTGEEFVAKKIGHDTARTAYTVDRTGPGRDEPSLNSGQISGAEPERSTPAEGVSL